jgi:hypothetical protein
MLFVLQTIISETDECVSIVICKFPSCFAYRKYLDQILNLSWLRVYVVSFNL